MRRRSKILIGVAALGLGTSLYFRAPLTDTFYQLTEKERSWIRKSSPLREPVEEVWRQWKRNDLSHTEAVQVIEKIIAEELPSGSPDSEIRAHVIRHFKDPSFFAGGARMETVYWINGYGTTAFMDMEIIQIWYISFKDRFLGAEIQMEVPKGQDLRMISLRSSNGETNHRVPYPRTKIDEATTVAPEATERHAADQPPAR